MTLDGNAIILVLILPPLPLYLGHILCKLMCSSFFFLLVLVLFIWPNNTSGAHTDYGKVSSPLYEPRK